MADFIAFLLWLTGQPPQEPTNTTTTTSSNDPQVQTLGGGIPIKPPSDN